MADEAWSRLESFVARRGGTLILSSGPRAWPGAVLRREAVRKLLPVLDPTAVAIDSRAVDPAYPSLAPGAAIMPTATAAESWPMLQLAASSRPEPRCLGGSAPACRGHWLAGPSRVPARWPRSRARDPTPRAVIATQAYGLGKVLWVGTDATWRWRFRKGDTYSPPLLGSGGAVGGCRQAGRGQ